jgi:exodeoxyribonuclease V beta subunit
MDKTATLDALTFPLHGSRLIEASAGTGKTFTLALLYVRLVLGHGADGSAFPRPLMPPEILVVTFTVAATKELRERIRARLVEAAELFETPAEDDVAAAQADPLHTLRDTYRPDERQGHARRLRRAAEWMDEAMIVTIHGWCQRMLQEHAFATRGLFQRELVTDQSDLIAEVLRDYWRVHFYPLAPAEARCIRGVVASPEALQKKLDAWLNRRDARLTYKGEPLQCGSLAERLAVQCELIGLEDAARAQWQADLGTLETLLLALRPHLDGRRHSSAKEETFEALLKQIAAWSQGAEAPTSLMNFAPEAFSFKKAAAVQTAPPHPAFAAIADWRNAAVAAEDLPTLEACLLAHATAWIERELPRRLHLRAEMGFDELLRDLDAALTPAESTSEAHEQAAALAATIRHRFPVALIDEFQDTDPIQYRIFDAVYDVNANDPATALLMIGDPKQAIYGFRGADIHAYLAARLATAGRHYTLATNFRSTDAVVAACNRLFGYAETQPRGAFRFHTDPHAENPIPYVEVTAKGREERLLIDGEPATAMTFWQLDTGESVIAPEEYRRQMAEAAASEVVHWLDQARAGRTGFQDKDGFTPLRPKHIAILVRTGTEAAAMREALTARRVHSVYLSDRDSVFRTEEAGDVLHWLRACAEPNDEGLVRAALGTNTLAIPLQDLARLQHDELAREAQIERFVEYRRVWQRQGVLAMLRRLMHEQNLPERLLGRDDGERMLTNLLHLSEWLQQSAGALDGERALIRHLSEHLDCEGEEFTVRLESDAELVQVVTIHKSKGLEYPLVLLPFICSWREVDGRTRQVPYRLTEQTGQTDEPRRYLEVAGKGQFPDAWTAADDERLSEDMRLLYVAVTRARHAVWLGIAPLKSGTTDKPQLEKSAVGHVLNGGQKLASARAIRDALEQLRGHGRNGFADMAIRAPVMRSEALEPETEATLEQAREADHTPFPPWWIASYSALRLAPVEGLVETSSADAPTATESAYTDTAAQETALEESAPAQPVPPRIETAPPGARATRQTRRQHTPLHALPRGSRYGTFLHGILEWAAVQRLNDADGTGYNGYAAAARSAALRRDMLARRCNLRGLTDWIDPLDAWLVEFLSGLWTLSELADADGSAPRLALQDLAPEQIQVEMEFWIESRAVDTRTLDRLVQTHCLPGQRRPDLVPNQLNGMLKGFIDLVFEHDGRYYVLDWKSNWLGPDDDAYTPQAMCAAMLQHRYDLQYALYLLALHRQLRARLPGYDYERHLGGAIYVFLRGSGAASQGLFTDRPPRALIERLDRLFAGQPLSDLPEVA